MSHWISGLSDERCSGSQHPWSYDWDLRSPVADVLSTQEHRRHGTGQGNHTRDGIPVQLPSLTDHQPIVCLSERLRPKKRRTQEQEEEDATGIRRSMFASSFGRVRRR